MALSFQARIIYSSRLQVGEMNRLNHYLSLQFLATEKKMDINSSDLSE
jgi:hypothetical protein